MSKRLSNGTVTAEQLRKLVNSWRDKQEHANEEQADAIGDCIDDLNRLIDDDV